MKKVAILGSTGSIGVQTLDVIRKNRQNFEIYLLSATGRNKDLLQKQIKEFKPKFVHTLLDIKLELPKDSHHIKGEEELYKLIPSIDADIFVIALSGLSGVIPTYLASKTGKRIALSNKESIVSAGKLIMKNVKIYNTEIIPVDSEHSAIFQCLLGQDRKALKRLILTASGGPFLDLPMEDMKKVSPKEALSHPVWNMGAKISIDSATMMNKGLEVIEASFLFNINPEKIDVVIHPEGIIHSMVEFIDNSIMAQLGPADMKVPISFALGFPQRLQNSSTSLDFTNLPPITFRKPDTKKFPLLKLAYEAIKINGTAPAILNAANEAAVNAFLQGKIRFTDIYSVVKEVLEKIEIKEYKSIDEIIYVHKIAETKAKKIIESFFGLTS